MEGQLCAYRRASCALCCLVRTSACTQQQRVAAFKSHGTAQGIEEVGAQISETLLPESGRRRSAVYREETT